MNYIPLITFLLCMTAFTAWFTKEAPHIVKNLLILAGASVIILCASLLFYYCTPITCGF